MAGRRADSQEGFRDRLKEHGFDTYEDYLGSEGWQERKQGALARAERRCQLCYSPSDLNVHHRTYERLGQERTGDLTVLCRGCHEHFHGIGAKKPKRKQPNRAKTKLKYKVRGGEVIAWLQANHIEEFTTRELAAGIGLSPTRAGQALTILVNEGRLQKVKAKRWRLPPVNYAPPPRKKSILGQKNDKLHEIQVRNREKQERFRESKAHKDARAKAARNERNRQKRELEQQDNWAHPDYERATEVLEELGLTEGSSTK